MATTFFFFNDTATTEIYTLSLHDALPISNFADFDASVPRIALIDRGTCDATVKVANAGAAGALAVVLVNDRPGVPPTLNPGLGTPTVPAVFITLDNGNLLKGAAAA